MAIANTEVYGYSLDGDMNDIFFDEYDAYQSEYDKIANVETAPPGNHYTESELSGLGALQTINQGSQVTFDDPVQGNSVTRYYTKYGLGFQITEEMYNDDLFGNFKKMPAELARSAAVKADTVFFDLFNNGFATHTAWDENYIFVNGSHTTLKTGDAVDNAPDAPGSLSETTLQASLEYFDNAVDSAGRPINLNPRQLMVPTELQWATQTLLKTDRKVGSMDNDINTMQGILTPFISRFLTSSTAWFVLSDKHDFRLYWKQNVKMQSADDFKTGNALFKATMRFAVFCNNYIGAYGNAGA